MTRTDVTCINEAYRSFAKSGLYTNLGKAVRDRRVRLKWRWNVHTNTNQLSTIANPFGTYYIAEIFDIPYKEWRAFESGEDIYLTRYQRSLLSKYLHFNPDYVEALFINNPVIPEPGDQKHVGEFYADTILSDYEPDGRKRSLFNGTDDGYSVNTVIDEPEYDDDLDNVKTPIAAREYRGEPQYDDADDIYDADDIEDDTYYRKRRKF